MLRWRDQYQVHPAAKLFPPISEEELRTLGEDIKANGLQNPVVILSNKKGEQLLLDGCNRLDAMEAVGIPTITETGSLAARSVTIEEPEAGFDPFAYLVSLNLRRRHLTREQRDALIRQLHAARSDLSTRALADITHTSKGAIYRALSEPPAAEVPALGTSVQADDDPSPGAPTGAPAEPSKSSAPEAIAPASGTTREPGISTPQPARRPGACQRARWQDLSSEGQVCRHGARKKAENAGGSGPRQSHHCVRCAAASATRPYPR